MSQLTNWIAARSSCLTATVRPLPLASPPISAFSPPTLSPESVCDRTDAHLRDLGVLWSGDHCFPGTVETLELLRKNGAHRAGHDRRTLRIDVAQENKSSS